MSNIIDMNAAREKRAAKEHGERQVLDAEFVNRSLYAGFYYLSCAEDGVQIQAKSGPKPGDYVVVALVTTANAYVEFFEAEMKKFDLEETDLHILCASSMDFPEEYTDRKEVVALCDAIRS